ENGISRGRLFEEQPSFLRKAVRKYVKFSRTLKTFPRGEGFLKTGIPSRGKLFENTSSFRER
ncbi:MAG: hypothetical protein J5622_02015, partial [Firmicutes bacterium]|nr:hypothetical protein [Bacillota bacterium]